jgi:hypothetical protein
MKLKSLSISTQIKKSALHFTHQLILSLLVLTGVVGCNPVGTPSFVNIFHDDYGTPEASKPTVQQLIDHIACELSDAMVKHLGNPNDYTFYDIGHPKPAPTPDSTEKELWEHLIEDNFVANINLILQVTNNQGIAPSLNFITPFTPIPIPSLTGNSSFVGNFTLAIGGQLNGNQFRTFQINYVIALAELYKRMRKEYYDDQDIKQTLPYVSYDDGGFRMLPCGSFTLGGSQLAGDLLLEEILINHLASIKRAKYYSMFTIPDQTNASGEASLREQFKANILAEKRLGGPKRPNPTQTTQPITSTSELDFTIAQGVNGGPNSTVH